MLEQTASHDAEELKTKRSKDAAKVWLLSLQCVQYPVVRTVRVTTPPIHPLALTFSIKKYNVRGLSNATNLQWILRQRPPR